MNPDIAAISNNDRFGNIARPDENASHRRCAC
jgi:hypothetical protein